MSGDIAPIDEGRAVAERRAGKAAAEIHAAGLAADIADRVKEASG